MKALKLILFTILALTVVGGIYLIATSSKARKSDPSLSFFASLKNRFNEMLTTSKAKTSTGVIIGKQSTGLLEPSSGNGDVPDKILPPETKWNNFSPTLFEDFDVPESYDSVMGRNMPNRAFIWHNVGRNMFTSLANMFKKGVTAVNHTIPKPTDLPMEGKRVQIGGGDGLGGVGKDDTVQNMFDWTAGEATSICTSLGITKDANDKFDVFMALPDYEGVHTKADNQDDANFLQSYAEGQKSVIGNYRGQMYLNSIGGGLANIYRDMFTGARRSFAWFNAANGSAVSAANGKKFEGDVEQVQCIELSYYYETMLEDGKIAKDQNGSDFFTVSHFGSEFSTSDSLNKTSNCQHWAAIVGGNIQIAYANGKDFGQKVIVQLKNSCQVGDGYLYNQENAQYNGNRRIQEWNRYGTLQPSPQGDYTTPIGSEMVTNFVAEAQVALAYFCGAYGINFWDSGFEQDLRPSIKSESNPRRGARYNDFSYANVDFEPNNYMLKTLWRLSQKVNLGGKSYSFMDICDGQETVLNEKTVGSWDGGTTFRTYNPLDWQVEKKTPMVAVVNNAKKVGFVLAFQAYGVEQNKLTFQYKESGANVSIDLNVPANKVIIKGFSWS